MTSPCFCWLFCKTNHTKSDVGYTSVLCSTTTENGKYCMSVGEILTCTGSLQHVVMQRVASQTRYQLWFDDNSKRAHQDINQAHL